MTVLAVVSDLHVNSTVAVCPARIQLDDGGEYIASKAQRWLQACWADAWERVDQLRGSGRKRQPLVVVVNGDVVDGTDHHNTFQTISRNPATMMQMGIDMLEPVRRKADRFYVVRGTESHVGGSGAWEEAIARDLDAEADELVGTRSWWHLPLEVEGVRFDIAHHTSMGALPWTAGAAAPRLAARILAEYAESGQQPPHVAVRSHVHRYGDSGTASRVRAVITPAWQLATGYVHRISPGALSSIGMVAFGIEASDYQLHRLVYRAEARPWVTA